MVTDTDSFGNYRAVLNTGPYPLPTPTTATTQLVAGNPNSLGTTGAVDSFAFDTVGLALYFTADGSTWTSVSSGVGGGVQVYSGTGSPVGVTNATTAPALYVDTTTPSQPNVWYTTSTGKNGWVEFIGN